MKRTFQYLAVLLLMAGIAACATQQKMSGADSRHQLYKYDNDKYQGEIEQGFNDTTGERYNYMLGGKNQEDCIAMRGWDACQ